MFRRYNPDIFVSTDFMPNYTLLIFSVPKDKSGLFKKTQPKDETALSMRHGSVIFAGARRRRRTSRRGLSRRFLPHRPLRRSGRLHHRNICRGQRKGLLAYHQGIPAQADCKALDIFSFLSQGRTEMRCRQAFWCAYLSFRGGRICRVSERRPFQEARVLRVYVLRQRRCRALFA